MSIVLLEQVSWLSSRRSWLSFNKHFQSQRDLSAPDALNTELINQYQVALTFLAFVILLLVTTVWVTTYKFVSRPQNKSLNQIEDWLDPVKRVEMPDVAELKFLAIDPDFQFNLPTTPTEQLTEQLCDQVAKLERNDDVATLSERVAVIEEKNSESEIPIAYLLSDDRRRWNRWRKEHFDQSVSLAGIDLTGKSLRGFDLSHVNLSNGTLIAVDFGAANLIHADLSGANLTRSSFASAKLSFADFRQANLQHCNLELADLSYAQLNGADLRGCSMSWAKLTGASLTDAILTSANLTRAILASANLTQVQACFANFEAVNFAGTLLVRADLSHSNFRWAEFAGADICGTNFTSALFDPLSLLTAIAESEDTISSKQWHYDRTTNFDHTLFSKKD